MSSNWYAPDIRDLRTVRFVLYFCSYSVLFCVHGHFFVFCSVVFQNSKCYFSVLIVLDTIVRWTQTGCHRHQKFLNRGQCHQNKIQARTYQILKARTRPVTRAYNGGKVRAKNFDWKSFVSSLLYPEIVFRKNNRNVRI